MYILPACHLKPQELFKPKMTLEGVFSLNNTSLSASLNICFSFLITCRVAICLLCLTPGISEDSTCQCTYCEKHKWPDSYRNNTTHSVSIYGFLLHIRMMQNKTELAYDSIVLYAIQYLTLFEISDSLPLV